MTQDSRRQFHLSFCRRCTHGEFDRNQGIICSVTKAKADFDKSCPIFEEAPPVMPTSSDGRSPRKMTWAGKELICPVCSHDHFTRASGMIVTSHFDIALQRYSPNVTIISCGSCKYQFHFGSMS